MSEQCSECRFWSDLHDEWAGKGDCRRYPPTLGQNGRYNDHAFPKTINRNWCGEFAPKPEAGSDNG